MNGTARFVAGVVLATIGGALVITASRLDWVLIETRGEPVRLTPERTVFIGGSVTPRAGHEVVSALLPLGVLIVLSAGLTLLASPRARRWGLVLAVAAGATALGLVFARWAPARVALTAPAGSVPIVRAGSARAVALAGAVVAVIAGLAAIPSAQSARAVRLPE